MAKVTITNTSDGPRGVRTEDGELVMIEPRETQEIELTASEKKDAEATGYFVFGEAAAKKAAKGDEGEAEA